MTNQDSSANRLPSSRRILVVDDNRDSAISFAMLLGILGHVADTAFDGTEGLEKATVYRPDVIFLDIGLPGLSGYDVCRAIRKQPWSKSVTIVALTGWGREGDRQKSEAAGFNEHLVKPVSDLDLSRVLDRLEAPGPVGQDR